MLSLSLSLWRGSNLRPLDYMFRALAQSQSRHSDKLKLRQKDINRSDKLLFRMVMHPCRSFEAALWHGDGRYLLIYKVDYFKIILNSLYVIALMDSLLNSSVNLLIIHVISDLFKKITFTALVKIKFITISPVFKIW